MQLLSRISDGRVNCENLLLEMPVGEYLRFAEAALGHNEFQRRRVKGSKTVYALLKEDLLKGCVIPPLVLSVAAQATDDIAGFLESQKDHLLILDGLQRTYTIIDVRNELAAKNDEQGLTRFICADRWMKNRYGAPLRKLVAEQFHLKVYVDMTGSDAFHQEVAAYPAITVICREPSGPTRIGHCPEISAVSLAKLAALLDTSLPLAESGEVREIHDVAAGESPWLIESSDQLALLRRLEKEFPLLEETGCKVGIGVATGADKVFIGDYAALDVEPECKLPLVTTRDIQSGEMQWRGLGVINPFGNGDGLVDLAA